MALQFSIYQDVRKGSNRLFYGRAIHPQTINLDAIAERVQHQCSMTIGDVKAVMTEMITVMKAELQNSNKVHLDGLGTFYLSISSTGAISADKYNANENVKAVRCKFLAQGKKSNGVLTRTFVDGVKLVKAHGSEK